jgi:hypothetical protein
MQQEVKVSPKANASKLQNGNQPRHLSMGSSHFLLVGGHHDHAVAD